MDIYSLLKKDHQTVSALFDKLTKSPAQSKKSREEIFAQIKTELMVHSESEESAFYDPLLKEKEAHELILEANVEHDEMTNLLEEISNMAMIDERWMAKCVELKELVEQHVKQEEGVVFSVAKQILDKNVAEEMGEKFLDLKQQHMRDMTKSASHPHTQNSDAMRNM